MFKWVEWIVMKNQPLSIVDCPLTREAIRYKPITSKLLHRNILALCAEMQNSIKQKLPDKFSIIFDGWSEGTVHYTSPAVFEALLLLKVNRSEWNVQTMGKAMGRTTGTMFTTSIADTDTTTAGTAGEVDTDEDPDLFYTTNDC